RVVTVQYSGGKELKGQDVGSGTVIAAGGHVVTNEHVTRNGRRFECTLSDKRRVPATLVGEDPLTDLAVLVLDLEALGGVPPVARFGSSADLQVGDVVMAMGSPFSLSRSVSLGIVSNTERVFAGGFGSDDLEELEHDSGQRTGLFTRWIQHDALISPGNSGGPLVNLAGEIVGINELGGGAHSFAIPSDLAASITRELVENGEVERSWLGLSVKPIQRSGLDEGVLISSVTVEGPAAKAGVEAGDVLLELDGEPLTVRFAEEVPVLLGRFASLGVGSEQRLKLRRGGEVFERTVIAERLERDVGIERAFHAWGFTAREITSKMARDLRLASTEGVLITGVRRAGPAEQAEPAVGRGDVLLRLAGQPVGGLDDLVRLYGEKAAAGAEPEPMLLELDRRGKNLLTRLEASGESAGDPPRELPKGWLGVATQPILGDLAGELDLGERRGFRITRVYPGTRAEEAGLRVGDLVVTLDGEEIAPRGYRDASTLERRIRATAIDSTVQLGLVRGAERLTLPVVVERTRLGRDEARRHTDRNFELTVRELTFFDRDENRWDPELRGVVVENVE
ncbi:MAG: PDZ domain-containing protein, partial [Holophagales bacterium]|nr:PDZ domain-containing protein [Holophagales bacterium]